MATRKKTGRTLAELFAETAPSFRTYITNLATQHGKETLTVFGWWREYCQDCRNYDQSAILSEFVEWYAVKLAS